MYVTFSLKTGEALHASHTPSTDIYEDSFPIGRDLYVEIMNNPGLLRELALMPGDHYEQDVTDLKVVRVRDLPRVNQTMQPMERGVEADIVFKIGLGTFDLVCSEKVPKHLTMEFSICGNNDPLTPICNPIKISPGVPLPVSEVFTDATLADMLDTWKHIGVFAKHPFVNFTYSYHIDH